MTAADAFQVDTEGLAVDTERLVLKVYADLVAARIDQQTAVLLIAAAINRARAHAVTLADLYVVAAIEEQTGQAATAVGVLPADESARLVKAATTILAEASDAATDTDVLHTDDHAGTEPADAEMRLTRLAHAEPFASAQNAAVEAMTGQPLVEGWVRQFETTKPCQLCVWIWRDGRVWPKNHPFQIMHTGDKCVPRVVVAQSIKSTEFTRRLERNS